MKIHNTLITDLKIKELLSINAHDIYAYQKKINTLAVSVWLLMILTLSGSLAFTSFNYGSPKSLLSLIPSFFLYVVLYSILDSRYNIGENSKFSIMSLAPLSPVQQKLVEYYTWRNKMCFEYHQKIISSGRDLVVGDLAVFRNYLNNPVFCTDCAKHSK
jgi:hypothetical protein